MIPDRAYVVIKSATIAAAMAISIGASAQVTQPVSGGATTNASSGPTTTSSSGPLGIRLNLQTGCSIGPAAIAAGSIVASNANYGILDFGTHAPTFTGPLTATALDSVGGSATQVLCTPDVKKITMTIDAGLYASNAATASAGSGARAMTSSSASQFVAYQLYADQAMSRTYTAGTAQTIAIPIVGKAFALPVHGLISKGPASGTAMESGLYSDTVQVTMAW